MAVNYPDADVYANIELSQLELEFEELEYTELLDLRPLPISLLQNKSYERLFKKFKFFNPL